MTLPIEFTTTVEEKQLIDYQRKIRMKRTLTISVVVIILFIIIVLLDQTRSSEPVSLLAYLIPLLVVMVLWFGFTWLSTASTVKKIFKENPSVGSVRAFIITLDTISHFSELSNGELSWVLIKKVEMTDRYITLLMLNGSFFMIDPADMDVDQRKDLKALFIEKGFAV